MLHDSCIEWHARMSRAYWVVSHILMMCDSHVCDTLSHVAHATRKDESCRICEWVMSHMWMSHVARVKWVMSHMWMSHVMCDKLIHICDSYSYVRLMYVTWFVYRMTRKNKSRMWMSVAHINDVLLTFICAIHVSRTHSYVRLDSFLRAAYSFTREAWLNRYCDVTSA